jgi:hypothetical protein
MHGKCRIDVNETSIRDGMVTETGRCIIWYRRCYNVALESPRSARSRETIPFSRKPLYYCKTYVIGVCHRGVSCSASIPAKHPEPRVYRLPFLHRFNHQTSPSFPFLGISTTMTLRNTGFALTAHQANSGQSGRQEIVHTKVSCHAMHIA